MKPVNPATAAPLKLAGAAQATAAQQPAILGPLRELLHRQGLDWIALLSSDAHQSEYPAPYWQLRQAFTGFDGSAGEALIGLQAAHLWVDSRYHLQAEQQAPWACIHKLGEQGVLPWPRWLEQQEAERGPQRLGLHPAQATMALLEQLRGLLRHPESRLALLEADSLHRIWTEAPARPLREVYALPIAWTEETAAGKLARLRQQMAAREVDGVLLTRLDEVAWMTNLRGEDIPHNPVFEGWLLVGRQEAFCFTDNPIQPAARQGLAGVVQFAPYHGITEHLRVLGQGRRRVWLDPAQVNAALQEALAGAQLLSTPPPPVMALKACKNAAEIRQSQQAHIQAGCALVRAFATLEELLAHGPRPSEAAFARLLHAEYARLPGFSGLSFPTIAGYGANAAIVHYSTPSEEVLLEAGSMLLVDSGIQREGATTDTTRTIAIGRPEPLLRQRFTQVLRGHIRLALQVFPEDCPAQALDALARSVLWQQGLDFGHGTGHGVGAFLNVHEGPHTISPRNPRPLEAGVIISNEPGWYQPGWGGIRCENLYVVREARGLPPHPAGRRWLRLEALTLVPFDASLILWEQLGPEEQQWLAAYQRQVREALAPQLEARRASGWNAPASCRPASERELCI